MFVRHEAVDIAVQRDRRVLMPQQLRQGFDIHSALQRTGGKGMPQGMEATVREVLLFQQKRKARLIGAHGNDFLSADHIPGRIFCFISRRIGISCFGSGMTRLECLVFGGSIRRS